MNQNGISTTATESEVFLPQPTLRRLQRLQYRVAGASEVAQAAINAAQSLQNLLQNEVLEACSEEGFMVPPGTSNLDIDWRTGRVSLPPQSFTGSTGPIEFIPPSEMAAAAAAATSAEGTDKKVP